MGIKAITTFHKTVASAGTAEALAANAGVHQFVTVRALLSNTGDVYLGDASVDANSGFVLDAGEELKFSFDEGDGIDIDALYIDVDTNGEGVSVMYHD